MHAWGWVGLVALAAAGCHFKPSEEAGQKQGEEDRDKKDLAEVNELHAKAMATDALIFDVYMLAKRSDDIQRLAAAKKVPASWFDEMEASLARREGNPELSPKERRQIVEARINIASSHDADVQPLYLKCVEVDPRGELDDFKFQVNSCFEALKDDALKVKACGFLRPQIDTFDVTAPDSPATKIRESVFVYVMADCLTAAKNAGQKLPWPTAAKDEKEYRAIVKQAGDDLREMRAKNDPEPAAKGSSGGSATNKGSSKKPGGAHCTDNLECESKSCFRLACATPGAGYGEVCQLGQTPKAACRSDLVCIVRGSTGKCLHPSDR